MQNKGGIARLTISVVLSLTVILYSAYSFLFCTEAVGEIKNETAPLASLEGAQSSRQESLNEQAPESSESSFVSSESASSDSVSVPASAEGNTLGRVLEQFISPYTASTSYSSVYLKNSTSLSVDIKELLSEALTFKIAKNDSPQVLIVHTHTTECFMLEDRDYYTDKDLTRTLDESYNMVRLGNIVAEKLNGAGIKTLHDTTTHDYPEYSGSYTRSAATIRSYLKKYPDIKIVIDMHRDAVASGKNDKVKLVSEINGRKAAQIMLVMGAQDGSIKNFPNWRENLKLAVRLQQTLEVLYPTLARPISFLARNYNESLTNGSMLIEMGTDANSIDEAVYSAELLAEALVQLLNTIN